MKYNNKSAMRSTYLSSLYLILAMVAFACCTPVAPSTEISDATVPRFSLVLMMNHRETDRRESKKKSFIEEAFLRHTICEYESIYLVLCNPNRILTSNQLYSSIGMRLSV
ncbi:hypothetical protein BYT27DRAFT_6548477 [Phlegmacium glaucopus]|nr:hypothetical protein BYT27DRAFT_6548477 [Phlegmacium glaucopus]